MTELFTDVYKSERTCILSHDTLFSKFMLNMQFHSFPDIRCGLIVLLARKMCNPITDNLYTVHSTGTSSTFDLYIGSGEP